MTCTFITFQIHLLAIPEQILSIWVMLRHAEKPQRVIFHEVLTCRCNRTWENCIELCFRGYLILRSRNFNRWLSFDDTKWHRWSACQMKPFWMFFHVSTLRDPWWHLEKVICEKPHFHYTWLEKIALALTHKIPFLSILGNFLSHLTTTISNPRRFPISRCNNPKNLKKLSQRSGPQCILGKDFRMYNSKIKILQLKKDSLD